ncbi:halocyanin domain-containing protein [Halegenticoccus tardaugens]|uniref:halocyanin domain-containing protein n=1 Tax=Halegenticoccus tardaugens TaxID=2071624 RepID=UPI00100B4DD5|nr:halocyanin domain-containing protein [Halegenticoccus tardaugens]
MTRHARNRRSFLATTGAVLTATFVAGCTGGGSGGGTDDGRSEGTDGDDGNGGGSDGGGESDVEDWMGDANNYDEVEDMTGESEVTVEVGADDGFAYAPAAIEIDSGTTVVWEWTGEGGGHDVADADGEFESELLSDAGETFEHPFEESGTYTYSCTPHEAQGMKGVVVVG